METDSVGRIRQLVLDLREAERRAEELRRQLRRLVEAERDSYLPPCAPPRDRS